VSAIIDNLLVYCQIQRLLYNPRTMSLLNLTAAQLTKAAGIAAEIERLNAELSELYGSSGLAPSPGRVSTTVPATAESVKTPGKRGPKKGGMSAAGRAAIAAAQKARWAKHKRNGFKTESPKAEKPAKRKMSAAGRAAIKAAQKARWAKVRAGK
jgi:hypothetical protein